MLTSFSRFASPVRVLMLLSLLSLVALPGCNRNMQRERDSLYAQNIELQDKLERARAALDASEGNNAELLAEIARLEAQLAENRSMMVAPPSQPVAAANSGFASIPGTETFTSPGSVTVRVPGDVLFASGKVDLRSSSKSTLNQIAGVIKREYPGNVIRVEGYTDSDPIRKSKWKDNLELSLNRAAAVERHLITQGIDSDMIYSAGFGASSPRESKAKSRRVEIVVVLQ